MKKLLMCGAVAAMFGGMFPAVQAATVTTPNFNVTVSLTAICTSATPPNLNFGSYTAFGATHTAAPTSTFIITCTRGLATPTFAFDTNDFGVIAGLNYSLVAANTANTAGTAATAALNSVGTAATKTIVITGGMAGGQAGDCAGLAQTACSALNPVSQVRTLTITY